LSSRLIERLQQRGRIVRALDTAIKTKQVEVSRSTRDILVGDSRRRSARCGGGETMTTVRACTDGWQGKKNARIAKKFDKRIQKIQVMPLVHTGHRRRRRCG
jgi:hypothetical protein